jgi:hypothetical protein
MIKNRIVKWIKNQLNNDKYIITLPKEDSNFLKTKCKAMSIIPERYIANLIMFHICPKEKDEFRMITKKGNLIKIRGNVNEYIKSKIIKIP